MSTIYGFFDGSHSVSSALIVDGKIHTVVEEERITRIKSGDNFIAHPDLSSIVVEKYSEIPIPLADYRIFVEPVPDEYARRLSKAPYEKCGHHDAHNYGSYFTSGFDGKVMSISYDGGGESSVLKVFLCEDGKMSQIQQGKLSSFGSLSHVWGFSVSSITGNNKKGENKWIMCKDEGKLVGMAPEGHYDEKIYRMLKSVINYKDLRFYPSTNMWKTRFLADMMYDKGYFSTQKKREIFSYNLQLLTENIFIEYLNDLHNLYPEYKKLCFSGGLFANVKLNQKINELDWVDEIYIYPSMGDEGLALGACIYKAVQLGEITTPMKLNNFYFGLDYSEQSVDDYNNSFGFKKRKYEVSEIANKINQGMIIGWFQGRFEHGPRALGNRSILVRPTDKDTHSKLNKRLGRYDIMPFAPVVLSEYFDNIFYPSKSLHAAQFMTLCFNTKEEWIDKIPSVIQKTDKSARPQVLNKESNIKYWELINEYYKISGIPVLLNTSFNSHNEPIIDNPEQAFEALNNKIIDELVIGDYVYFT